MRSKLIVAVFDGMSNKLLFRWAKNGQLPHFQTLLAGQGGELNGPDTPHEAPAICTAFSGAGPAQHGVFSYWKVQNRSYHPELWRADQITTPMIWQLKQLQALVFGVINIFPTDPPYPVNGYLLSYLLKPTLRCCYPPDLLKSLRKKGLLFGQDVFVGLGYGKESQGRDQLFDLLIEIEELRLPLVLELVKKVDVLLVNFTLADRVAHYFWQELQEDSPFALEKTLVFQAYRYLDTILATLLETMREDTNLLLFSSVGMGPLASFISINDILAQEGFLTYHRDGSINRPKTLAFEAVQGAGGLCVNRTNYYSEGCVKQSDYERVIEEVTAFLAEYINPQTQLPLFRAVARNEQADFPAKEDYGCDILLYPQDMRYLPLGDPYWAQAIRRSDQSAAHRSVAFWSGQGPAFKGIKQAATLYDIAPTIITLLGGDSEGYSGKALGKP